jgi:uncharacterized protein DUF4350
MRRVSAPVLALTVSLLVLAVLAVLGGAPGSNRDDTSSRNAGRGGTLAMYLWLGGDSGLGFDVHRVSGSFDLAGSDVLIIDQPTVDLSDADVDAVLAFVRDGGELIIAGDATSSNRTFDLFTRLGAIPEVAIAGGTAHPVQQIDPAGRVHDIPLADNTIAFRPSTESTALLASNGTTVMTSTQMGSGSAYVLGSPYPFSNLGLRADSPVRSDAYALVLTLLERARGGRIAFDEFHHGEGSSSTGAAAIFYGSVGLACVLAALVVFVYIALSGRRLGRTVPAGDATRVPSAGEFVEAMAHLYERSRLRGPVAERYAAELKERVAAVSGVDHHLDDAAFVAALAGYGDERVVAVRDALAYARAMAQSQPRDADLLNLARHVDAVEQQWTAGAAR